MEDPRCAPLLLLLLLPLLLTPPAGDAAVITGACDKDSQCGGGMCCAVSIWVKSIRICTPMGQVGDSCHPLTRKVPFWGRRMHHTCPCLPGLACLRTSFNRFICLARKWSLWSRSWKCEPLLTEQCLSSLACNCVKEYARKKCSPFLSTFQETFLSLIFFKSGLFLFFRFSFFFF